jgi:SAM-dependent methyltransferase
MSDTLDQVRAHYGAQGLMDRIRAALAPLGPESQPLTVIDLAPLDQFHTRGLPATADLASAAELKSSMWVLDVGSGLGGPARFLASTVHCQVTGVDLSPSFVEAANYLTARCGLSARVDFQVGDALRLAFEDGTFDAVFLQHVAMNIEDRAALYAELRRVLTPDGRLATYDLVRRDGDVHYPAPWARDAASSFLLTETETRAALEAAGFSVTLWRDDTQAAIDWFQATMASPPQSSLNLGVAMGPEFMGMAMNLARNIREGRLGVLSAVLTRD